MDTNQQQVSQDISYSSAVTGANHIEVDDIISNMVVVESSDMKTDSAYSPAVVTDATQESIVPYTVCYAYDKRKDRSYAKFLDDFRSYMRNDNDFIFSKECFNEDQEKDNRYMIVIRKDINDQLSQNDSFTSESGILLRRYISRSFRLNPNVEYGFFIKTDKIDSQKIYDLFTYLEEKGFIHPDSYQFHYPQSYPDGSSRKYVAITFDSDNKKNVPRKFISKLRNLLNDTEFDNGEKLKIDWLQKSVFEDMMRKRVKTVFKRKDQKPKAKPSIKNFRASEIAMQL